MSRAKAILVSQQTVCIVHAKEACSKKWLEQLRVQTLSASIFSICQVGLDCSVIVWGCKLLAVRPTCASWKLVWGEHFVICICLDKFVALFKTKFCCCFTTIKLCFVRNLHQTSTKTGFYYEVGMQQFTFPQFSLIFNSWVVFFWLDMCFIKQNKKLNKTWF